MRLSGKTKIAIVVTLVGAGVFARLGIWQLSRLGERRAYNTHLVERIDAPAVVITSLSADTSIGHYRRSSARGVFDFSREVTLATRSLSGSPGVHVLTPLRITGDTVVMVNRGWLYAADAQTVDLSKWREREGDTVTVIGYAETWIGRERSPLPSGQRMVRTLDSAAVAALVGAPIQPYVLVQTSDSATSATRPVRLEEPQLDEGSHKGYAFQWFSFMLIALIGGSLVVRQELATRPGQS